MTQPNRVGQNLKRLREALGLRQWELAEKSRVSQQSICYIETGRHRPKPTTLVKLAKALGCAPTDLDPSIVITVPDDLKPIVLNWSTLSKKQKNAILKAVRAVKAK